MPGRTHEYHPGEQYGCWTVVHEETPLRKSWGLQRMVRARCQCGSEEVVLPRMLRRGGTYCQKCNPGRKRTITYNPGDVFGNWTIVREVDGTKTPGGCSMRQVLARCSCRREHVVTRGQLRKSTTCRTCSRTVIVRVGQRFGSFVVVDADLPRPQRTAFVRCDCGKEREAAPSHLVSGAVKSCGCRMRRRGLTNPRWRGVGRISGAKWKTYMKGAKIRGWCFEITMSQAWEKYEAQGGRCALTGINIDFKTTTDGETTASLDRIDSSVGYVLDNVQWVHKDVNRMKQNLPEDRFVALCQAVASYKAQVQIPSPGG